MILVISWFLCGVTYLAGFPEFVLCGGCGGLRVFGFSGFVFCVGCLVVFWWWLLVVAVGGLGGGSRVLVISWVVWFGVGLV